MTMLYKSPGALTIWGVSVDHITVDAGDVAAKLADGWSLTVHGAEQDAKGRDAAKLAENEAEQARIAAKLEEAGEQSAPGPSGLSAVHKGRGKWAVVDAAGVEVQSGLTKEEAQAAAGG